MECDFTRRDEISQDKIMQDYVMIITQRRLHGQYQVRQDCTRSWIGLCNDMMTQ